MVSTEQSTAQWLGNMTFNIEVFDVDIFHVENVLFPARNVQ